MEFGKSDWRTFEHGIEKEWLLTNGIGGFASSTIIGANTRRYHGLLVAAMTPPVGRHLVLSKIDESMIIDGKSYNLYTNKTPDHVMRGYFHLQRVIIDPIPTFIYNIGDVYIKKTVCMIYGKNTVVIVYHVKNGECSSKLRLTPLVNFRDYHHNSSKAYMNFSQEPCDKGTLIKPNDTGCTIRLYCSIGNYTRQDECYYLNMDYPAEKERGLHSTEDHYIPGFFDVDMKPLQDTCITFTATIEPEMPVMDGMELISRERERLGSLEEQAGYCDDFANSLVKAADAYIVYRQSTDAKTIIAGYPWFTDWGRDTMIAFTGITLATRRFEDARQILYTFSKYIKDGLIPNMFPDGTDEPAYNTVDAPLWYFEAVGKYLDYTEDYNFVRGNIYGTLKQIIGSFTTGTHFDIKMDNDFLISAGNEKIQLTWMDAKIGDWVVTPRHGKAVEINALWYNALMVMERISKVLDEKSEYKFMAGNVKDSFIKSFWNEGEQCLYDVITDKAKDGRIRPNQILAVSLSNPIVEGEMARNIVRKVWRELYTAYGIRSLSPIEKEYVGVYEGDPFKRDSAYHQGTVWAWLSGHFITAFLKANGYNDKNMETAFEFIRPFKDHLSDGCIGHISEIFDGNEPLIPRGCFAQAWSVGEILRAYSEDILGKGTA